MLDLPKHPVLRGHPIHAMLSDLPIGLLPAALVAAALARTAKRSSPAARTSDALTAATFAAAGLAGTAGIWDWLTIPRRHAAWWPATFHGLINASGLALLGVAWRRPERRLALLSSVGAGSLVGAWLGGDLVFAHGWRVKPAEEYEIVAERVRESGDGTVLADAQREVEAFEGTRTFLP